MKLTDSEREFFTSLIDELDEGRYATQGGYPSQWSDGIRDNVVRATVDHDNAPQLEIYKIASLKSRIARARRYLKANKDASMTEAWYRTERS